MNRMIYHAITADPESIVPDWTFKVRPLLGFCMTMLMNLDHRYPRHHPRFLPQCRIPIHGHKLLGSHNHCEIHVAVVRWSLGYDPLGSKWSWFHDGRDILLRNVTSTWELCDCVIFWSLVF